MVTPVPAHTTCPTLDGWQKLAVNDILATNEIGELAAFEYLERQLAA